MPQQLDGARLKLERAKEHIDNLHFRIRQFCEGGVHRITVESDAETRYETLKIVATKKIPADFSLILGDALHNLSSALDLAWFELTAADTPPRFKDKINFPVFPDRKHLEQRIADRPKQASLIAMSGKLLDEIQPYKGGNGDAIYAIHHLNIADKHRLLIPQIQIGRIEAIRCEDGDGVQFRIGPRHFDEWGAACIYLGDRRNVKVIDEGQSTLAVVFGVGEQFAGIAGLPVIPTLRKFWRAVRTTLTILAR